MNGPHAAKEPSGEGRFGHIIFIGRALDMSATQRQRKRKKAAT